MLAKPVVKVEVSRDSDPAIIEPPRERNIFQKYWDLVGGGSLAISLLVHAVLDRAVCGHRDGDGA